MLILFFDSVTRRIVQMPKVKWQIKPLLKLFSHIIYLPINLLFLPFKRQIKSHLPFASITRRSD